MKKELIIWRFQSKTWKFGFVIPDEREAWGGDFFVNKSGFNWAADWDRVEAKELLKSKWKKPEAKIINILTTNGKKMWETKEVIKVVEWIYSGWDGNFGFIDIEGQERWFFVYWPKKNWAKDWDKVRANIIVFKDKQEAIVTEILSKDDEVYEWVFNDNEKFWFVLSDIWDIFIAGSRKANATDWDKVEVKIIKKTGKNPEWLITRIL